MEIYELAYSEDDLRKDIKRIFSKAEDLIKEMTRKTFNDWWRENKNKLQTIKNEIITVSLTKECQNSDLKELLRCYLRLSALIKEEARLKENHPIIQEIKDDGSYGIHPELEGSIPAIDALLEKIEDIPQNIKDWFDQFGEIEQNKYNYFVFIQALRYLTEMDFQELKNIIFINPSEPPKLNENARFMNIQIITDKIDSDYCLAGFDLPNLLNIPRYYLLAGRKFYLYDSNDRQDLIRYNFIKKMRAEIENTVKKTLKFEPNLSNQNLSNLPLDLDCAPSTDNYKSFCDSSKKILNQLEIIMTGNLVRVTLEKAVGFQNLINEALKINFNIDSEEIKKMEMITKDLEISDDSKNAIGLIECMAERKNSFFCLLKADVNEHEIEVLQIVDSKNFRRNCNETIEKAWGNCPLWCGYKEECRNWQSLKSTLWQTFIGKKRCFTCETSSYKRQIISNGNRPGVKWKFYQIHINMGDELTIYDNSGNIIFRDESICIAAKQYDLGTENLVSISPDGKKMAGLFGGRDPISGFKPLHFLFYELRDLF